MELDIKNIQKSISLLLVAEEQPIHIDVALAIIYVFLLRHEIKETEEVTSFISFRKQYLKKYRAIANKIKAKPYKNACIICYLHLKTIEFGEKKRSLESIKNKLKIIANIEDNGFLSLSDILFPTYLKILNNTTKIDELTLDEISWYKDIIEDSSFTDNDIIVNYSSSDDSIVTQDARKDKSNLDGFKVLYYKLLSKEGRTNCKYAWQWLLTQEEYDEIKECINENKDYIPTKSKLKFYPEVVKVLTLYFGEYYKREYSGNNRESELCVALDALCELANVPFYSTENDTNRWKYSLYVNGGLPVNYIVTKLKNNDRSAFINCLALLFNPEDEFEKEQGKQLLNKLGNTSLVGSYNLKDSIYEYIDYINRDLKICDDSDETNQTFIDFKKLIDEGKKAFEERAKFRFDYSLWKFNDELELSTEMRFNVEEDGDRHYAINESRLKEWGVSAPKNEFILTFKDADKAIANIRFCKCSHGDYIEHNCATSVSLPIISKEQFSWGKVSLQDYDIVYASGSEEKTLRRSVFNSPYGYIQFYTNDNEEFGELWTSNKGGRLYVKSAIMFDLNRIEPLNCHFEKLSENIGWVVFKSQIELKDKKGNKHKIVYNSKGSFIAVPTNDSIHKFVGNDIVICEQPNMLKFEDKEHNEDLVYIINPSGVKFDIIKEKTAEKLNVDATVTYTQGIIIEQEYNSRVVLNQGYVLFSIRFGSYKNLVPCFVLNNEASVKVTNTGTSHRLDFNGIGGLAALSHGYSLTSDNKCIDSAKGAHEDIEFEISDAVGSLKFKTFRPKPAVIAKFPDNTTVYNNLLVCFADCYNIRVINNTNCKHLRLAENKDVYKFLLRVLTSTTKKNNTVSPNATKNINELGSDVPNVPLVLRAFTHEIQENTRLNSDDFYFLNFNDLQLRHISCHDDRPVMDYVIDAQKEMNGQAGLLFQSIRDVPATETLYASKYIPGKSTSKYSRIDKIDKRTQRLSNYVEVHAYSDEIASRMFDLADEHGLYFAQFDNLLSILWDKKNSDFLPERYMRKRRADGNLIKTDNPNPELYQRIADFLNTYSELHPENFSFDGLLRLSREFIFDWAELEKARLKTELSESAKSILKILIKTK